MLFVYYMLLSAMISHHMIRISIVLQVFITRFIIPWIIVRYVIQFKYSVIFPG